MVCADIKKVKETKYGNYSLDVFWFPNTMYFLQNLAHIIEKSVCVIFPYILNSGCH